jgi:hypothetical protein
VRLELERRAQPALRAREVRLPFGAQARVVQHDRVFGGELDRAREQLQRPRALRLEAREETGRVGQHLGRLRRGLQRALEQALGLLGLLVAELPGALDQLLSVILVGVPALVGDIDHQGRRG